MEALWPKEERELGTNLLPCILLAHFSKCWEALFLALVCLSNCIYWAVADYSREGDCNGGDWIGVDWC